jgi:hypothetical protein
VTAWTADEVARMGRADEIRVASRRADGSLTPFITIWAATLADDLYVRSAYGPDNGWYRRAKASGSGRIQAGGVERDVDFVEPDHAIDGALSGAYHAKYDRYGPAIVGTVVSRDAEKATLRVVPR